MYKDTIVLERYFETQIVAKARSNMKYWAGKLHRKEEVRILGMLWRVTLVQSSTDDKQTNVTVNLEYVRTG